MVVMTGGDMEGESVPGVCPACLVTGCQPAPSVLLSWEVGVNAANSCWREQGLYE